LLSPFGIAAFTVENASSQAWTDVKGDSPFFPLGSANGANLGNMLENELLCSESFNDGIAGIFELALSFPSSSGGTLADDFLSADAEEVGKTVAQVVNETRYWADGNAVFEARMLTRAYFAADLDVLVLSEVQQLQKELVALNASLASPDGGSQAAAIVLNFLGGCANISNLNLGFNLTSQGFNRSQLVNRSQLAVALKNVSNDLEASGLADWLRQPPLSSDLRPNLSRYNFSEFGADSGMGSTGSMMESMMSMMQDLGMDSSSFVPSGVYSDPLQSLLAYATPRNLNLLLLAAGVYFEEEADLMSISQTADKLFWWISHFLRSRSMTAGMLGEMPGDTDKWLASIQQDMAQLQGVDAQAEPMLSGDFVGEMPQEVPTSSFRTEAGASLYGGLVRMRQEAAPAVFGLEAATFAEALEQMAGGGQQLSSTTSALEELRGFADRLANLSAPEIEQSILPGWEADWSYAANCSDPRVVAIGSLVKRTHERCPFYRAVLPELAKSDLPGLLEQAHASLKAVDWDNLEQSIKSIANDILPDDPWGRAAGVVARVQRDFKGSNALNPTPREVSKRLAWELTRDRRWQQNMRVCQNWPYGSSRRRGAHGGGGGRRRSRGRSLSPASNFIRSELTRRKVLVAPYKGDVKRLIDMAIVEATHSAFEDSTKGPQPESIFGGLLGSLTDCPLVRGLTASSLKQILEGQLVKLGSEEEAEDFSRKRPDDVLMALIFKSADPKTGKFPSEAMKVDYAIRVHAQLLPATDQALRISRYAQFGGFMGVNSDPYLDFGFANLQEVIGRAAARLQSLREDESNAAMTEIGRNIAAGIRTAPGRRLRVSLEQFPIPRYELDGFIRIIQHTLPMFLVLGWIYAVSLLVREVVYEKQERLRDVMRIQGLRTWVYWLSWMTSALIQLTLLVSLLVTLLSAGKVLKYSDPSVLFVFFWLYSLSTVSFSMLVSAFFSRAKVAAAVAGLAYWMAYMPYSLYNRYEEALSIHGKNAMCLLSSTAMGVGMLNVGKWEMIEVGVQWSNVWAPSPVTNSGAAPSDDFSLGSVFFMLIVDTVLYQVLAWYVEKVNPGTLGLPQPWYFPVSRSYWFPAKDLSISSLPLAATGAAENEQTQNAGIECWEAPSEEVVRQTSVQLRQLAKTFPGGKQALKGITLNLHDGTIMGLLGHNGAGKSTAMSILTGLYPPTSGDVLVHGRSVREDSIGVRQQLGVCLQHNALYENITVEEHLRLFCCLKSVPPDRVRAEVDALLRDTGMEAKRYSPSRALSGGMKRKLSIAIALAGGSKVVTLDEPTAGVDVNSRRDIWHLLARYKVGRTILLSTHFMDEADILSDRIAVIAEGQITAVASSMTLKRHFADGYLLTVVCAETTMKKLAEMVLRTVPSASFAGARGREFCFVLPFNSVNKFPMLFEKLEDTSTRAALKIDAYGLSAASMEEVFLRASSVHEKGLNGTVRNASPDFSLSLLTGQRPADTSLGGEDSTPRSAGGTAPAIGSVHVSDADDTCQKEEQPLGATPTVMGLPVKSKSRDNEVDPEDKPRSPQCMTSAIDSPGESTASSSRDGIALPAEEPAKVELNHGIKEHVTLVPPGPRFWFQQFDALFRKRALSVRRDRKAWASQLVLPAIFVFLALLVARILEVREQEPPMKLTSDMLIGTVNGGTTSVQSDSHTIPFADQRGGKLSSDVLAAFRSGKGQGDIIDLLDGENITMGRYLMDSGRTVSKSYGGVSVTGEPGKLAAMTLWFKQQAIHAVPIMVNLWNNARLQLLGFEGSSVEVWSHPLPKTEQLLQEEMTGSSQVYTDLLVSLTVILAMGFIPASFVVYLVHEKATNGKHQQLLTGVSPGMYWISSYCWDIVNFLVPLTVCFILFGSFQVLAYSGDNTPAIFLLLFCYGLCMTPLMYCVEPLFSVPSTAYVTLICVNIFTGTISTLAITVLEAFIQDVPELEPLLDFGLVVFPWVLPNYCLGRGMLMVALNSYGNYAYTEFGVCARQAPDGSRLCWKDPLSWDVSGRLVTNLIIMAPVWLALRLLIEWGFCLRGVRARLLASVAHMMRDDGPGAQEDQAVLEERDRVAAVRATSSANAEHLVIDSLEKSFVRYSVTSCCSRRAVSVRAVRGITVGVQAGECFGLLGVNGAGKTTTMRMITGDTEISQGDVLVDGASVQNQRDKARRQLGYCPQFDALPDKLTVWETIALYSRIRGIPAAEVPQATLTMIRRMCLEAHRNSLCEHLSGGNKRKLSTALALIGEPDVVLLDEPSTGVDVGARRFLWDIIGDMRLSGRAVVLTSHSMEECEVLCTRLTIMVHGQFRCLGSPVELKAKYGGGYTLSVKGLPVKEGSGRDASQTLVQIRDFVKAKVPQAKLTEVSVGLLRYHLSQEGQDGDKEVAIGEIFRRFEEAGLRGGELEGCLSDYSLSQTSLEEVFLHFSHEAGVVEDPEIRAADLEEEFLRLSETAPSSQVAPVELGQAIQRSGSESHHE